MKTPFNILGNAICTDASRFLHLAAVHGINVDAVFLTDYDDDEMSYVLHTLAAVPGGWETRSSRFYVE